MFNMGFLRRLHSTFSPLSDLSNGQHWTTKLCTKVSYSLENFRFWTKLTFFVPDFRSSFAERNSQLWSSVTTSFLPTILIVWAQNSAIRATPRSDKNFSLLRLNWSLQYSTIPDFINSLSIDPDQRDFRWAFKSCISLIFHISKG